MIQSESVDYYANQYSYCLTIIFLYICHNSYLHVFVVLFIQVHNVFIFSLTYVLCSQKRALRTHTLRASLGKSIYTVLYIP